MTTAAHIQNFFDTDTGSFSYVVYDNVAGHAAVIDPVLQYDAKSGQIGCQGADELVAFIQRNELQVDYILETHAHADHLSAAHYIKQQVGGKIAIGAAIRQVQAVFKSTFNLGDELVTDGSQFDVLIHDGDVFQVGALSIAAMSVAGHTLADMAFMVDDAVFVGDSLFMPDLGTARCDFPGGDAHSMYRSVHKILALPAQTRLFMCHDYPPSGRTAQWQTTVAAQREHNIHVHTGVDEASFVTMRQARDASLSLPRLIYPAIQVNIRAGNLPPAETNGMSYIKIPVQYA